MFFLTRSMTLSKNRLALKRKEKSLSKRFSKKDELFNFKLKLINEKIDNIGQVFCKNCSDNL